MKFTSLVIAFTVLLLCYSVVAKNDPEPTLTLNTPSGYVRGYLQNDAKGYAFRGIPYAQANRWEHSTRLLPWKDVLDAKLDPPGFPQNCSLPPHTCPESTAENAFFVNVFTPVSATQPLPVMVWFHGGNYKQGSISTPLYNGTTFAAHDTIVIAVNYRLGALGFHVDDLLSADGSGATGNYGFKDQVLALQWVRDNVASFGGDPDNVTIFGQSAGGGAVATHLISPASQGLFHRAIIQSNPWSIPFRDVASKDAWVDAFRTNTNCSTTECFQNLSLDQILTAQYATERDLLKLMFHINLLSIFLPWTPYVDGQIVPAQPLHAYQTNTQVKDVSIVLGSVAQEADIFIYEAFDGSMSAFDYKLFLELVFGGDNSAAIVARFPPSETQDNRDLMSKIATQFIFQCSNRKAVRALTSTTPAGKLYSYHFDHVPSFGPEVWSKDYEICYNRQCHGVDLVFTFDNSQWLFNMTNAEQKMSDIFNAYWTNFAHSGYPDNGPIRGLPNWPAFPLSNQENVISLDFHTVTDFLKDDCDFWDTIGYVSALRPMVQLN